MAAKVRSFLGWDGTLSVTRFRSWLDAVGTAVGIQQKMMRHADVATTINVYGKGMMDTKPEAHTKTVGYARVGFVGLPAEHGIRSQIADSDGRGGGIRTPDPLLPKQMRYQAALRPDILSIVSRIGLHWIPLAQRRSMGDQL